MKTLRSGCRTGAVTSMRNVNRGARASRQLRSSLTAALLAAAAACGGDAAMEVPAPEAPRYDFQGVTDDQWRVLAGKRVYFGHQSVGANIMDGVADVLSGHPNIGLHVADAGTLGPSATPGLYHAKVGRNEDPRGKLTEFVHVADSTNPQVALVKYCYIDITDSTDADALFADYRERIEALRARHPGLIIVHVTLPLTTVGSGPREWLSRTLRGHKTPRDLMVIRSRYNDLMRRTFVGKEPVFDLARFESTRPDGSRSYFSRGGRRIYYLAPEYTDDGGHLNATARRAAAEEFLAALANAVAPRPGA